MQAITMCSEAKDSLQFLLSAVTLRMSPGIRTISTGPRQQYPLGLKER